jgi:uncharacterized membrane protein YphA (DoxX/SURF4 family)
LRSNGGRHHRIPARHHSSLDQSRHLGMKKCLFRGITTLPPSTRLEVPRPLRSRGCPLQRLFSTFPNGFPGGGLFLLRFVIALNAVAEGIFILSSPDHETASGWCLGGLAVAMGGSILMGFLTPICCGLAAIGNVIMNLVRLPSSQASALASPIAHLNLAIICVALVLLGPGAFSLDARLFGRREIIIPRL